MTAFHRFARLLQSEVGYAVHDENRPRLERLLRERAAATVEGDLAAYVSMLEQDAPAARDEWQEVLRELTMSESFFFRDAAQFRLLRETLLPRLIARRSDRRTLRVWSAGCSTGEEPYSLAILLHEMLPARDGWDVSIVGTDVNESSLERARRAVYTPWSLRGLTKDQRERYFVREGDRFALRPEYRRRVTFQRSNLVKDRIPSFARGLHDLDLILCRNVFIYFDAETTGRVAEKLARALAPGGYLVTGHAELHGQRLAVLRTRVLPGSVVHERPTFDLPRPSAPAARPPDAPAAAGPSPAGGAEPAAPATPGDPPAPARQPPEPLLRAGLAFQRADYEEAVREAGAHLRVDPDDVGALRLAATAAANLGQHTRAAGYCRRLLELRPKDVEARYLLAKLAQERGANDEARDILIALLSSEPSFVPGYLDLAWLEKRAGNVEGAEELREKALELLQDLPPGTILSAYEGVAVEDLLAQLQPATSRGQEER